MHVHKLLGLACLGHFLFRFAKFPGAFDLGFGITPPGTVAAWLCVHTLLSCSSLIFKLPSRRIKEGSRIWPEYRLHSIVFAVRSLLCMLLVLLERKLQCGPHYEVNALIVIGTMAAADAASRSVGDASRSSTIQDLAAPAPLRFFFSAMQFHATTGCLIGLRTLSTQFVYLFIIQCTAFAMTLRRKNLVGHTPFVFAYFAALLFGFAVATADALSHDAFAMVNTIGNAAALARLGLRVDKYKLWVAVALIVHVLRDSSAVQPMWVPLWLLSTASVVALGYMRSHTSVSDVKRRV